ncbi:hypothetical protein ACP4OV_025618 [Aristida adscensionis]
MSVAAATIAAALVIVLQLSLSASPPAAAAASAAADHPATMEHCRKARCGEVEVPYPFGITPGCSYPAPGFNLTCDTSHDPPWLLLGDGTTRVVSIFPKNSTTMIVHRTGAVAVGGGGGSSGSIVGHGKWPGAGSVFGKDGPFVLAPYGNELVVTGCNVMATLRDANGSFVSGCSAVCSGFEVYGDHMYGLFGGDVPGRYCSDGIDCCQNLIPKRGDSFDVVSQWIDLNDSRHRERPPHVFIAKKGWYDEKIHNAIYLSTPDESKRYIETVKVPVVLTWVIRPSEGLPPPQDPDSSGLCPDDVRSKICKSENSACMYEKPGYMCICEEAYQGNPYLPGGCQDLDECKMLNPQDLGCFGECINTIGSFDCRCPEGTRGNHSLPGGCIPIPAKSINKGSIIIIAVASGTGSVFLVLIAIFLAQRYNHLKALKLKQKHFKQNRGQLLRQLVSQRADIAERMIIPVDELEKATNHFDKARELGGGGHGTVYKGILSDQHVVAIKKSKITVQKEIDEFINEVAILSQINHRNVVKLFGCCLETEVPLLVYEFISNGTLYHHLHVEGPRSLCGTPFLESRMLTVSIPGSVHN